MSERSMVELLKLMMPRMKQAADKCMRSEGQQWILLINGARVLWDFQKDAPVLLEYKQKDVKAWKSVRL